MRVRSSVVGAEELIIDDDANDDDRAKGGGVILYSMADMKGLGERRPCAFFT